MKHSLLTPFLYETALVVILAGCGQKATPEPTRPQNTGMDSPAGAMEPEKPAPDAQPAPFTIEYRMITYFPTCRGNTRVKVDREGKVWFQRSDKDCPRDEDFSAPYPEQPKVVLDEAGRGRLLKRIVGGGFFDLKAPPRGPVSDGYREEIEVTLEGRHLTVTVHDGARLDGWNELKSALLEFTH
ncbi:hypothetical protein KKD52_06925 [Myxococcota bacterium]|nr:hypothetical protein [Myxococcota bacterium]MBU1413793.1 hypothetical protein [Myxococcota bacterium]MBU1510078.1 hypothetical protein [Myxococcota bacterium]